MYAAGKIPGGFKKREGRPGDEPIIAAISGEQSGSALSTVFIIWTSCRYPLGKSGRIGLSSPEMAAMIGSSMALSVSDIPFQGPIAGVNVGYVDGKYVCS
jgi:polyribonucleotide nucleotidyltransferase